MSDHYCYDGTEVLANRYGIRDHLRLNTMERFVSELRMRDVLDNPQITVNGWGLNTLCRIHRALFGEVYSWAGRIRDGNIGKDGLGFCDFTKVNYPRLKAGACKSSG